MNSNMTTSPAERSHSVAKETEIPEKTTTLLKLVKFFLKDIDPETFKKIEQKINNWQNKKLSTTEIAKELFHSTGQKHKWADKSSIVHNTTLDEQNPPHYYDKNRKLQNNIEGAVETANQVIDLLADDDLDSIINVLETTQNNTTLTESTKTFVSQVLYQKGSLSTNTKPLTKTEKLVNDFTRKFTQSLITGDKNKLSADNKQKIATFHAKLSIQFGTKTKYEAAAIIANIEDNELDKTVAINNVDEALTSKPIVDATLKNYKDNSDSLASTKKKIAAMHELDKENNHTTSILNVKEFFAASKSEQNEDESMLMSREAKSKSIRNIEQQLDIMIDLQKSIESDSLTKKDRLQQIQQTLLTHPYMLSATSSERQKIYYELRAISTMQTLGDFENQDEKNIISHHELQRILDPLESQIRKYQNKITARQIDFVKTGLEVLTVNNNNTDIESLKSLISIYEACPNDAPTPHDNKQTKEKVSFEIHQTFNTLIEAHGTDNKIFDQIKIAYRNKLLNEEITNNSLNDTDLNTIDLQMDPNGMFILLINEKNSESKNILSKIIGETNGENYDTKAAVNIEKSLIIIDKTKLNEEEVERLKLHETQHVVAAVELQTQKKQIELDIVESILRNNLPETHNEQDKYKQDEHIAILMEQITFGDTSSILNDELNTPNNLSEYLKFLNNKDSTDNIIKQLNQSISNHTEEQEALFKKYKLLNEHNNIKDELAANLKKDKKPKKLYLEDAQIFNYNKHNTLHQPVLKFIKYINSNIANLNETDLLEISLLLEKFEITPAHMDLLIDIIHMSYTNMSDPKDLESTSNNITDFKNQDNTTRTETKQYKEGNWKKGAEMTTRQMMGKMLGEDKRKKFGQSPKSLNSRGPLSHHIGPRLNEETWLADFFPSGSRKIFFGKGWSQGWGIIAHKLGLTKQYPYEERKLHRAWPFIGRIEQIPIIGAWITKFLKNTLKLTDNEINGHPFLDQFITLERPDGSEHKQAIIQGLLGSLHKYNLSNTQLKLFLKEAGLLDPDFATGQDDPANGLLIDSLRLNPAKYYFLKNDVSQKVDEHLIRHLIEKETLTYNGTNIEITNPNNLPQGIVTDNLLSKILEVTSPSTIKELGDQDKGYMIGSKLNSNEFNRTQDAFNTIGELMMQNDMSSYKYDQQAHGDHYTIENLLLDISEIDELSVNNQDAFTDGSNPIFFKDGDDPNETLNPRKYVWIGGHNPQNRVLVEDARRFVAHFYMARAKEALTQGSYGNIGNVDFEKDGNQIKVKINKPIYKTRADFINQGYSQYTINPLHAEVNIKEQSAVMIFDKNDFLKDDDDKLTNYISLNTFRSKYANNIQWLSDALDDDLLNQLDDTHPLKNFSVFDAKAEILVENTRYAGSNIPIKGINRFTNERLNEVFGKVVKVGNQKYIKEYSQSSVIFGYVDWYGEKVLSNSALTVYQFRFQQAKLGESRAKALQSAWEGFQQYVEIPIKWIAITSALAFNIPGLLLGSVLWTLLVSNLIKKVGQNWGSKNIAFIQVLTQLKSELAAWETYKERQGSNVLNHLRGEKMRLRDLIRKAQKATTDKSDTDMLNALTKALFSTSASSFT